MEQATQPLSSFEADNNFRLRQLVALGSTKRPYNMTVQVYEVNTYVPLARGVFAFMFTNVGDTVATVNGMVVFPSATPIAALGDSRSISGHEMEIYTGNITLSFRAPLGSSPAVEIVQLYYI